MRTRLQPRGRAAFTLVEIALAIAVIAFALVAIIGVLPSGLNTQRDNREETIINQDAQFLMEAIRGGQMGLNQLTSNVTRIVIYRLPNTNSPAQTFINPALVAGMPGTPTLTNGYNIIGYLSRPKYYRADDDGTLLAFVSTAEVRALNSALVEQGSDMAFSYRLAVEIIPYTAASAVPEYWGPASTNHTDQTITLEESAIRRDLQERLAQVPLTYQTAAAVEDLAGEGLLYEVRLHFSWPLLANGHTGPGRKTFRTVVAAPLESEDAPDPTGREEPARRYFFKPSFHGSL